jgi:MinD-like ATPase involved in chromosome partitioning or flagellar assembly
MWLILGQSTFASAGRRRDAGIAVNALEPDAVTGHPDTPRDPFGSDDTAAAPDFTQRWGADPGSQSGPAPRHGTEAGEGRGTEATQDSDQSEVTTPPQSQPAGGPFTGQPASRSDHFGPNARESPDTYGYASSPPPVPPHQTSSAPVNRPTGQWDPKFGAQPLGPSPPASSGPPSPPVPGPGQQRTGPQPIGSGQAQQPPGPQFYTDRIRVADLVPARKPEPTSGWRRLVLKASFGLINLGPSPAEVYQAELKAKIRSVVRGHFKVGVMGKGGVGKTMVSASIGSVFAELRQEDRVVAVDADTAFGKLGSRIDPNAPGSYWELAADQYLESFADLRSHVGTNAAALFVLPGEGVPARRRVLDPAIYREATSRLDRYFSISIIDCGSTMDSPVTQEVIKDLDALIVVTSPWVDGATAAGQTLDWLASHGKNQLLQSTVVVLNDSDGHADKRTRSVLAQQFAGQGLVVIEVPFDADLRPGGVIDGTRDMSPGTRRRFVEIAAALAEHFPTTDDRSRERH